METRRMYNEAQHILNAIQDMAVILDTRQRVVWANRAMKTFLAVSDEDIVGRHCSQLFRGAAMFPGGCPCERVAKNGRRETIETELPDRDLRVRITAEPFLDGQGEVAGILLILSDTTAVWRAEGRARLHSGRLDLLSRISGRILNEEDIGTVLAESACGLSRFLGVPRCTIFLSGPPGEMVEHCEPGFPSAISAFLVLSDAGGSRGAFREGQTRIVNDILQSLHADGIEGAESIRLRAFIGVPLLDREEQIGLLFIDRPEPHEWTENEIETAEMVAQQIAVVVRQTRALRQEKELAGRLLSLMNNVPGVTYRGLRNWAITLVGAEVERLTGYAAEAFLRGDVSWKDIIHPYDLPGIKMQFRKAVAERRSVLRVEYRIIRKNGNLCWLEDRRQIFYRPDGSFEYVDGLLLDITDRKRAEEELRAMNQTLQALFDASPLSIIALDKEGRVTMWNRAAERTFGWTREEVIGLHDPIVPPDKMGEFHLLHDRVIREGGFSGVEIRRRKKGGEPVDVSLSTATMRDAEGKVVGIMSVMMDITERKRVEEALKQSEEQLLQAQKMEAVGRLAGGVAHDFNNLLTAIRGYADLLLQRLDEDFPYRKDVEEILKAGERASSLTQQLLAFSRKQVMVPHVLDLNEVVENMEDMIRRMIGEDIDLVTLLRPGLWSVKVDRGQIEQVVMNLVVNARDAVDRGGKITIETGNVLFDQDYLYRHPVVVPGAYAMLAVSDTGCGMDEETKARLFEPFFTTKEMGKGTGLGLSTVYGIVKQSNGYIWVYSELHRGSVFKIYLPRHDSPAGKEKPDPRSAEVPKGSETILLVEDDELVRTLARDVLRGHGYTVLEAHDGADAMGVAVSHRGRIHLLVTDVVMPNMGGQEVAAALSHLHRDMKVLFMSGYADDAIERQGILSPGTRLLQKPFRIDALLRKVREVLDG